MKFIKDLSKLHLIPLVIGLVFLIALVVVLATTVMLRKDLIHEESLQLAGKYKQVNTKTASVPLSPALKPVKNATKEYSWNGRRHCIHA
jgi:hypothetical protein